MENSTQKLNPKIIKQTRMEALIESVSDILIRTRNNPAEFPEWVSRFESGKIGNELDVRIDVEANIVQFYCDWEKESIAESTLNPITQ